MEIKINKEIREYSEKVLFGLTARQFVLAVIAIAISLVLYFIIPFQTDIKLVICLIATSPFILMGFAKVQGHTVEEYIRRRRDRVKTPELKIGNENIYFKAYQRYRHEERLLKAQQNARAFSKK